MEFIVSEGNSGFSRRVVFEGNFIFSPNAGII